jgi:hypothetical protein
VVWRAPGPARAQTGEGPAEDSCKGGKGTPQRGREARRADRPTVVHGKMYVKLCCLTPQKVRVQKYI